MIEPMMRTIYTPSFQVPVTVNFRILESLLGKRNFEEIEQESDERDLKRRKILHFNDSEPSLLQSIPQALKPGAGKQEAVAEMDVGDDEEIVKFDGRYVPAEHEGAGAGPDGEIPLAEGAGAGAGAQQSQHPAKAPRKEITKPLFYAMNEEDLVKLMKDPTRFAKKYKIIQSPQWGVLKIIEFYKIVVQLDHKYNYKYRTVVVKKSKDFWQELAKKCKAQDMVCNIGSLKDKIYALQNKLPFWRNHLDDVQGDTWYNNLKKHGLFK